MKFNDSDIAGPDPSYVGAMAVTVTGGTAEDRLAVKNVIFNALEGRKFREVNYVEEDIPYSFAREVGEINEPVEHDESLLSMCVELNPLLFYTSITLESAPSLLEGGVQPDEIRHGWKVDPSTVEQGRRDMNEAWERAQRTAANDGVKEVTIEGTVRFKF